MVRLADRTYESSSPADRDAPCRVDSLFLLHSINECSYNAHARFLQERLYVWLSTEGVLDLCNRAVSEKTEEKTPQFILTSVTC